jgi:Heterokaryon incompatibility protein (HET)
MAQSQYTYTSLRRGTSTRSETGAEPSQGATPIRILNLYPGEHNDTLLGDLIVRKDENYECLSYSWGPEVGPEVENPPSVGIMHSGKSWQLRIRENLALALRHLRHKQATRYLWVDAICINQDDKNEKSHQIPMMGKIYGEATNVCIWLGEKADTSITALDHIRRVLDLQNLDRLVSEGRTADWAALSELMRRDWFSRRWVVQEIAFARSATVHCGSDSISWSDLADAVALFGSRAEEIADLFRGDKIFNHQVDFLGDVEALGANRLVRTISKLFRKSDDGKKLEPLLSLEALVSNLSAFNASKPHDIIYAVLSLANDTITSAKESDVHQSMTPYVVPTIETHDSATPGATNGDAEPRATTSEHTGDGNARLGVKHSRRPSNASHLSRSNSPSASPRLGTAQLRRPSIGRLGTQPNGVTSALFQNGDVQGPTIPNDTEEAVKMIMTLENISDEDEVREALKRVKACRFKHSEHSPARISDTSPEKYVKNIIAEDAHEGAENVTKDDADQYSNEDAVEDVEMDVNDKRLHDIDKPVAQRTADPDISGSVASAMDIEFLPEENGETPLQPPPRNFWDEDNRDSLQRNDVGTLAWVLLQRDRVIKQEVVKILKDRVENKTFQVDYENKKFYEVCQDFINFTIKTSKSLDMLCRPWAPDKADLPGEDKYDLPSWICPLSRSPFRPRHDGNFGRVNADLLVGMPDTVGRTYNASVTTRPEHFSFVERSLIVRGFVLDEIEHVRTEAIEGNIPHEWLELAKWEKLSDEPPESFWRTLVADRDDNGRNPPSYYQRACQYAFTQRVSGGSLNTQSLISNDKSKIMTRYLKRVQAVVWMRKLIKTSRDELLGLAPHRAKKGDKICILRGCSVPVILRPVEVPLAAISTQTTEDRPPQGSATTSKTAQSSGQATGRRSTNPKLPGMQGKDLNPAFKIAFSMPCTLIGECYVHGVMDGEAFKIRDKHELKEGEFRIC